MIDEDISGLLPEDEPGIFDEASGNINADLNTEPTYGTIYGNTDVQAKVDSINTAIQGSPVFEGYTPMGSWDISPFGDWAAGSYSEDGTWIPDTTGTMDKKDFQWHDPGAPYTMYKSDETGEYSIIDPKTGDLVPLEGSSTTGGHARDDLQYQAKDKFENMLDQLEKEKLLARSGFDHETNTLEGDTSWLSDEELAKKAGLVWDDMDSEDLKDRGFSGENIDLSSRLNFQGTPGMSLQDHYSSLLEKHREKSVFIDRFGTEHDSYFSGDGGYELALMNEFLKRRGINVTDEGILEYASFGKQFEHSRGGKSTLGMDQSEVPTFEWQGKEYHTRTKDEVDIIKGLQGLDEKNIFDE